ncbi:VOC family protein [Alienimonas chondri]|uniref:VOC domain-containing protein n=1 Tax=Alienimonas chondri TaxID=2681879 RepID=A0ABX1VJD9_9PLAN|nr:VOC family protein [Alienimonas chondri]NNJ27859.1 hypothetical protein [Alienimonas chondri]
MSDAASPINAVGWFEIYVSDMDRAVAFYEATLAVTLETLDMSGVPGGEGPSIEMRAFPMALHAPGAAGALVKMEGDGPVPGGNGGTLVYFSCEDCAVDAERAAKAGGTVLQPKMSIGPYGFIAILHDTEGNTIGLHSQA